MAIPCSSDAKNSKEDERSSARLIPGNGRLAARVWTAPILTLRASFFPTTTTMAGPFVYVPEASSSAYQPYPYYATATPQGAQTPFLPPSPLLYPTSPFLAPADIHHTGTPGGAFNPNSVLWPEESSWGPNPYGPQQPPAGYVRQRTRSWAGPAPPQGSPFLTATPPPAFLHANSFSPRRRAN
ncbi:hypothetical protein C8F01DRAFT_676974 [Mycena amicta]|nr:hypothetical protein C8F01DRAFT_676974 [Mycena amicta]